MIEATDGEGKFTLEVDAIIESLAHVEVKFKSAGVGAIAAMAYNVLSGKPRLGIKEALEQMLE
jgi:hypothetical protein